jgi:molecular chaperone GrpE
MAGRIGAMTARPPQDSDTPDKTTADAAGDTESPTAERAQESAPDAIGTTQREYDQVHDKYMRLMAEFDNYKKRATREREQFLQFANEELLKEWLPVVDNIERALRHVGETQAPPSMAEGLSLIHKQCLDLLGRAGVTAIESVGKPFNPELHQAVAQRETADGAEQAVLEEVQRGYVLKGRLLRPALVTVSTAPSVETTAPPQGSGRTGEQDAYDMKEEHRNG